MKLLVTGSNGLVGGEVVSFFASLGHTVFGIDNNQREVFFGKSASTRWNQERLKQKHPSFSHYEVDIRNRQSLLEIFESLRPDAIVHAAAQPSHDRAADIPFDDFDINAVGTLNLLESVRRFCPDSPFVYLSTNKVYGDIPNRLPLVENSTRWDYSDVHHQKGINEVLGVDQCLHSLFGASKLSADILVQEYGRYFNIPTCCLRGGCLTGPSHAGVELHGFLSYLIKCNYTCTKYKVFGHQGKQVRDNIHSYDVASFISFFIDRPRIAQVYNLGGGYTNSISILEAFGLIESISGKPMIFDYLDSPRKGDHIVYYSDLSKMKAHYSAWSITKDLSFIFKEIYDGWYSRLA